MALSFLDELQKRTKKSSAAGGGAGGNGEGEIEKENVTPLAASAGMNDDMATVPAKDDKAILEKGDSYAGKRLLLKMHACTEDQLVESCRGKEQMNEAEIRTMCNALNIRYSPPPIPTATPPKGPCMMKLHVDPLAKKTNEAGSSIFDIGDTDNRESPDGIKKLTEGFLSNDDAKRDVETHLTPRKQERKKVIEKSVAREGLLCPRKTMSIAVLQSQLMKMMKPKGFGNIDDSEALMIAILKSPDLFLAPSILNILRAVPSQKEIADLKKMLVPGKVYDDPTTLVLSLPADIHDAIEAIETLLEVPEEAATTTVNVATIITACDALISSKGLRAAANVSMALVNVTRGENEKIIGITFDSLCRLSRTKCSNGVLISEVLVNLIGKDKNRRGGTGFDGKAIDKDLRDLRDVLTSLIKNVDFSAVGTFNVGKKLMNRVNLFHKFITSVPDDKIFMTLWERCVQDVGTLDAAVSDLNKSLHELTAAKQRLATWTQAPFESTFNATLVFVNDLIVAREKFLCDSNEY